jgi:hypothetical protein
MAESLRLLILDDQDAGEILAQIEGAIGGAKRVLRKVLVQRFTDVPTAKEFDPDITVFDYLLHPDPGAPRGLAFLMAQAQSSPDRLCILKSSPDKFPNDDEERQLDQAVRSFENIRVAKGLRWDKALRAGVVEWLREGGARRRGDVHYRQFRCALGASGSEFEQASRLISANWTSEKPLLESQLAAAKLLGRLLATDLQLPNKLERPYLKAPFALNADVVPWEFMLLDPTRNLPMDTPIVRTIETAQPPVSARLRHMLFVHAADTQWEPQWEAAQRCLSWRMPCQKRTLSDLVSGDCNDPFDIVHIAMHNHGLSQAEVDSVQRAIVACGAKIVVFAACDSARLFVGGPRSYAAENLFAQGVDCLIATQFPLEETTLELWALDFYSRLAVFGDVGIAAAAGRQQVAMKAGRLWEMATIVVARHNSPFVL